MTFDPAITLSLIAAIAAGGNLAYSWLDKGRARRWAREDAELVAADLKMEAAKIAEGVRVKLAEDAAKVATESTERAKTLAITVTDNITTSTAAIKASNALNEKIADLTKQLIAVKRTRLSQPKKRSLK